MVHTPSPTKESEAYIRYADTFPERDEKDPEELKQKYLLEFPRGKPYRIINAGELYRVEKPKDHLEQLRRSKSFIADKYFGPFDLKESNLRTLLIEQKAIWEGQWETQKPSEQYVNWREQL
jgi:hypothetical protein